MRDAAASNGHGAGSPGRLCALSELPCLSGGGATRRAGRLYANADPRDLG